MPADIEINTVESLKIELKNGDTTLATNELQTRPSSYSPSPFNIGRTEVHDAWAWKRGAWSGENDVVPTKATITYVVAGTTYIQDVNTGSLTQPEGYAEADVNVATYIAGEFAPNTDASTINQDIEVAGYTVEVNSDKATIKKASTVVGTVILRGEN